MRNVVVTGGSRGLGVAISTNLAGAGYCAIAVARKESRELTAAIAACSRAEMNSLQFLPFDFEDIDAVPHFVASLRKSFGAIYGLVNNAARGDDGALSLMQRARIVRRSALRRLPAIDDVAAAVEFLLGARSASITGTVLTVDAGSTA